MIISMLGIFVCCMFGSIVLAPILQKNAFEKGKGCLSATVFLILYTVVYLKAMDCIRGMFERNQILSINLFTIVIVSGIISAVMWVSSQWSMRHQLACYKKGIGDIRCEK